MQLAAIADRRRREEAAAAGGASEARREQVRLREIGQRWSGDVAAQRAELARLRDERSRVERRLAELRRQAAPGNAEEIARLEAEIATIRSDIRALENL